VETEVRGKSLQQIVELVSPLPCYHCIPWKAEIDHKQPIPPLSPTACSKKMEFFRLGRRGLGAGGLEPPEVVDITPPATASPAWPRPPDATTEGRNTAGGEAGFRGGAV
jgi:hypothetical protein